MRTATTRPPSGSRLAGPRAAAATAMLLGALGSAAGCAMGARRADFTTPDAVVRTYVRAFLDDDPAAEYRCLAESFKDLHGATLERYIHFRGQVEEALGSARTLARLGLVHPRILPAEPAREGSPVGAPSSGRARDIEVATWGWHIRFRVEPEGWFRVVPEPPGAPVEATVGALESVLRPRRDGLEVSLEDRELGRMDVAEIREVRLAEDWKIADIRVEEPRPAEP